MLKTMIDWINPQNLRRYGDKVRVVQVNKRSQGRFVTFADGSGEVLNTFTQFVESS